MKIHYCSDAVGLTIPVPRCYPVRPYSLTRRANQAMDDMFIIYETISAELGVVDIGLLDTL